MNEPIILSNAGLELLPYETYFEFATRAAREHERRGDIGMAQRWRDARWVNYPNAPEELER